MKLLLDTHIFIWACSDPSRIKAALRKAIAGSAEAVFVSAATAWEISIKRALGRLEFPVERIEAMLADMELLPLHVTLRHAVEAGALPKHHADPFDRMLIAQARAEGLTLASIDRRLTAYDVPIFGA
ncbi:MAG: type II toxin-antitoxin system VapC family toxin [Proteobacteria bacterium]|nr:type II toxin-antitoxin system VapC family toxin [Pseudomonadota bacterium]